MRDLLPSYGEFAAGARAIASVAKHKLPPAPSECWIVTERPPLADVSAMPLGADAWAVLDCRVAIETGSLLADQIVKQLHH
jgi:hypothetical protein